MSTTPAENENSNRAYTMLAFSFWIVSLGFLFFWGLLLLWGYRHWPTLNLEKHAFFIGLAALYPVPWVHMTLDRRVGTVVLCLSCYLALSFSVILLPR
jgi:hypothetical protein